MTPDEAISKLAALRAALRTGDLSLVEATDETLRLIESSAGTWSAEDLGRVRESAARSGELLRAAASGLRSVRRRLNEIATLRESAGTYGADGRKAASGPTPTRDARA